MFPSCSHRLHLCLFGQICVKRSLRVPRAAWRMIIQRRMAGKKALGLGVWLPNQQHPSHTRSAPDTRQFPKLKKSSIIITSAFRISHNQLQWFVQRPIYLSFNLLNSQDGGMCFSWLDEMQHGIVKDRSSVGCLFNDILFGPLQVYLGTLGMCCLTSAKHSK